MKKTKFLSILFLFSFLCTKSQSRHLDKAYSQYENLAYQNAIEQYEKLAEKEWKDEEIYAHLGDSYYRNGNYKMAFEWYYKLFQYGETLKNKDRLYRYALSSRSTRNGIEESEKLMFLFCKQYPEDSRAKRYQVYKNTSQQTSQKEGYFKLSKVSFNTSSSDFAPSFYKDVLLFSTANPKQRFTKTVHDWSNRNFLNIQMALPKESQHHEEAKSIIKILNTRLHESTCVFTKDGKTVYFTRSDSEEGSIKRDAKGINRLHLYQAQFRDGKWSTPIKLSINIDGFSTAHPALGQDEKQLYFASDRPGSYGESDIYVVDILLDGSFGIPKNLGNTVNTESRETFPYVDENGVLYFASDGHPGYGGLDIFAQNSPPSDSYVTNLGPPVNSTADDFTFMFDKGSQRGFFASNRSGGAGEDDIYQVNALKPLDFKCTRRLEGIVKNKETEEFLSGVHIELQDTNGVMVKKTTSLDGAFIMELDCHEVHKTLVFALEGYHIKTQLLDNTTPDHGLEEIFLTPRQEIAVYEKESDIMLKTLEAIYFDFDKSTLNTANKNTLRQISKVLTGNPTLGLLVNAHTDSHGPSIYNEKLSKRRGQSVVNFFIGLGISESRIVAKFYGESELSNRCSDNVPCSIQEHRENRRVEFAWLRP